MLDTKQAELIKKVQTELINQGKLYPRSKLDEFYRTFQEQFSPMVLQQWDGRTLLENLHDHGNRDSLVYWLEFKNDDDFPAIFGSIAGGSALKFGVFRRKETGNWETRGESNKPIPITEAEAIEIARKHRDQLVSGSELLQGFSENATASDYQQLQEQMDIVAPDVSRLGWGHKYFSLHYPHLLDDYHNPDYQRFFIIKMLQESPEGDGRYSPAWWFVQAANEVDMPLNHLTFIFNQVYGRPHQYWRVGHQIDVKSYWEEIRDGGFVGIGWSELGDLSGFDKGTEVEAFFKEKMASSYTNASALTRKAREVRRFTNVSNYYSPYSVSENDIVLAMSGQRVLGIGRVTEGYEYVDEHDLAHRHPVEWLSLEEWKLPTSEGIQTTCHRLHKYVENKIEIERRILYAPAFELPLADKAKSTSVPVAQLPPLAVIQKHIQSVLKRKKQVILYGPPGTGKTYWAQSTARELAARSVYGQTFNSLDEHQKSQIEGAAAPYVRLCSFHPAYGYEDFLEGYHPKATNDQMMFEKQDGIFKELCTTARGEPGKSFYLIIDEINRGDIPRIFGELITLLEADKRGQSLVLPLSSEPFDVPANVYIIGTMNTADRSIALLDAALRRRFGFIEFMPDVSLLQGVNIEGIPLDLWLEDLNRRIIEHVGRDARNLQIGHAYLMISGKPISDFTTFSRIVREDIIPLLEEYCYEDYVTLEHILGKGLVDSRSQRIKYDLFNSSQQDDLVRALLELSPEITTSGRALSASSESDDTEVDDFEDDNDLDEDAG